MGTLERNMSPNFILSFFCFAVLYSSAEACKSKSAVNHDQSSNSGWTEKTQKSGYCTNPEGRRVRCYGLQPVTCPEGCDAAATGFDCIDVAKSSYFTLICPVVIGENCLAHLASDQYTCRRCCRWRDCGEHTQQCKYTSKTDTCPENGQGCPWDKVESKYDRSTLSEQICEVDPSCDSVMSEDGNAIGSGISCRRSTRRREFKKKFCCRNPTPTQ